MCKKIISCQNTRGLLTLNTMFHSSFDTRKPLVTWCDGHRCCNTAWLALALCVPGLTDCQSSFTQSPTCCSTLCIIKQNFCTKLKFKNQISFLPLLYSTILLYFIKRASLVINHVKFRVNFWKKICVSATAAAKVEEWNIFFARPKLFSISLHKHGPVYALFILLLELKDRHLNKFYDANTMWNLMKLTNSMVHKNKKFGWEFKTCIVPNIPPPPTQSLAPYISLNTIGMNLLLLTNTRTLSHTHTHTLTTHSFLSYLAFRSTREGCSDL